MNQDIVKSGVNARAIGMSVFDNPFLKSEKCPAATGETIEEWSSKERAWNFGWEMEEAVRSGRIS